MQKASSRCAVPAGAPLRVGPSWWCRTVEFHLSASGNESSAISGHGEWWAIEIGSSVGDSSADLWVRDHGPGIPPAARHRVFRRFDRISTRRGVEGSRLGLSIVDAIAKAHEGYCSVSDTPGGGATVTLHLPLGRSHSAADLPTICVVCAPEGVAALGKAAPVTRLFTASIDSGLNEIAYIVPGLGDAGDRQFGPR